jgi:acetyl-CoA carboxylase beta subunit
MIEIKCPHCDAIGKMSLVQEIFEGPYRCWKCRSLFTIIIANKKLQSCEPLSEEEFAKWQEAQDILKRQTEA